MTKFDPHASWLPLQAQAAAEANPTRSALINEVALHMEYEIKGQLEALMGTLTEDPIYHMFGNGEPMVIQGHEAVTQFYSGMMATGGQQFHVVIDKCVASDDHVITEGQVKQVYQSKNLIAMGVTEINGTDINSQELWMSNAQLVTLWPADAKGKLIGEDIYFGQSPMTTLTPITRAEIPDYYQFF